MKEAKQQIASYFFKDWYAKVSFLFLATIAWNWVNAFEGYWWQETFDLIHLMLISATVIQFLVPGPRLLRIIIHLLAIVAIHIVYLDVRWLGWPSGSGWARWELFYTTYASQFSPFIGISLLVWALLFVASMWTRTRAHLLVIVGATILSLAVADSFTPLLLWDDMAWIVFVGLIWLVAEHFSRFQRQHPQSFRGLLKYPISLFLPMLLIISVVMGAGLMAPWIDPVLKDPYTLWKEARGEAVPSFIGDKGGTTGQSTATDRRSGYSRSDASLGSGFTFDYSPVMEVTSSKRSYWRGESKRLYTGEGWMDNPYMQGDVQQGVQEGIQLFQEDSLPEVETEVVTQTFRMLREEPFPVLFAAYRPARVEQFVMPGSEPGGAIWASGSHTLVWQDEREYPESYTVVSEVAIIDEEALRNARAGWNNRILSGGYLDLPELLPQRVRDLAEEITSGATNDYDKARALETYLRTNFTYNNQPDISKRRSADFVDAFLFEIQEGYCDYYSTAMAVMARSVGLPSRWVKGYVPGVQPFSSFLSGIGEDGLPIGEGVSTYTVRNADAHSWVEIYFEGHGWVPFEPTSGFTFPYTYPADAEQPPEVEPPAPVEPTEPPVVEGAEQNAPAAINPWWFVGPLLVALATAAIVKRKAIAARLQQFRYRNMTANERIVYDTERLLRSIRRRGYARAEHETFREALGRWRGLSEPLVASLQELLGRFEQAKYSKAEAAWEDAEQVGQLIRSIREQL